jgi:hypothetical protein
MKTIGIYLLLGSWLALALVSVTAWNQHKTINVLQGQVKMAQADTDALVIQLKASDTNLTRCEAASVVDKDAHDKALADQQGEVAELETKYGSLLHRYNQKISAGACKAWAQEPSCVSP